MAYSTKMNCSECGVEIDPNFQALMLQEMLKNPQYGKWWRANKCVPCNTRHIAEMIKFENQITQIIGGWDCLNWQNFPDGLL